MAINIMLGLIILILVLLIAAKYFLSTPVYWFHLNSCPHCVAMEPEWQKFESMCMISMIRPIAIESSLPQNQKITQDFGVSAFPTIIKVVNDKPEVYSGQRTAADIYNWASS